MLSPVAQQRRRFDVRPLPGTSTLAGNALDEALYDNAQTPVPDQVSFRLDFTAWLATLTDRDRRLICDLMLGERTADVAGKHGLSAGRVSQLRREFMADWQHFAEPDTDTNPPGTKAVA